MAQEEEGPPPIGLQLMAGGLTAPIDLEEAPDGSGRLFIVDQAGVIRILTPEGELMETPFLDVRDRMVELMPDYDERGLLGLAFHPDFMNNGRFFVYYNAPLRPEAPPDWDDTVHLSEFTVSADDPNVADPASERILLMIDKPQFNHNGGDINFGFDGMLYIPIGDGGGADDVDVGHTEGIGNAQDLSNLLGSVLRINVDGGDPYGIPEDNPFVGDDGIPDEIWAWGFRNPWRMSFDSGGDGQLFVADAGQDVWEEVSIVTGGNNYGWNLKEGTHCFDPNNPEYNPLECPATGAADEPLVPPIIEYNHQVGLVVVGGFVYRGSEMPDYNGNYIFGDWSATQAAPGGRIFAASPPPEGGNAMWHITEPQLVVMNEGQAGEPQPLGKFVLAFGEDANLEQYVLTQGIMGPTGDTGEVWKLVPVAEAGQEGATEATGTTAEGTVDVGLVEFEMQMPNTVAAGSVTFNITNNGTMEHSFEIEGNGVEVELESTLQPGESGTLTIDLAPGTYTVYCPVGDHRSRGMELTLTVTEAAGASESSQSQSQDSSQSQSQDASQSESQQPPAATEEASG
jgi:glucose/arabinose dehydrogenase/uncharacterized cupredoxin-like copper-binding protein